MKINLGTRTRKVIAAAVLAAVATTGMSGLTPLHAAKDAGAMEIGPSTTFARTSYANITCNSNHNQVRLTIGATAPKSGQWVRYRYYMTDGRTGSWTQWNQRYTYPGLYGTGTLFDFTFNTWDGGSWNTYVEVQWHNGSFWTNHQGYWAQQYQAGYYYHQTGIGCRT